MRYLRSRDNFFVKHLKNLPIGQTFEAGATVSQAKGGLEFDSQGNFSYGNENVEETAFISQSHCRGWLLKSVALELHVSAAQKQVRQTQDLLSLLFSNPTVSNGTFSFVVFSFSFFS
jgi:nuclear pore complex protein Nup205